MVNENLSSECICHINPEQLGTNSSCITVIMVWVNDGQRNIVECCNFADERIIGVFYLCFGKKMKETNMNEINNIIVAKKKVLHKAICLRLFKHQHSVVTNTNWSSVTVTSQQVSLQSTATVLLVLLCCWRKVIDQWEDEKSPEKQIQVLPPATLQSSNGNQSDWPLTFTGCAGRTEDGVCSCVKWTCFLFHHNQGVCCVVVHYSWQWLTLHD